ncbi:hypothetical protein ABZP36_002656 [Zizania latifolia]
MRRLVSSTSFSTLSTSAACRTLSHLVSCSGHFLDAPKRVHAVPYIGSHPESVRHHQSSAPVTTSIMATARAIRVMASRPSTNPRSLIAAVRRCLLSTSTEAGGAGDPSVHPGGPLSEDYAKEATRGHGKKSKNRSAAPPSESTKEHVPPFAPSGKLGSQELANPAGGSSFMPKRRLSSGRHSREEATPGGEESTARKVREEDREYYRTHKPSPS